MTFRGELYYIAPVVNIPSILAKGILSHKQATSIKHASFALASVQERRDLIRVPNGMSLHEYANLYFDARNPAMFSKHELSEKLCVLVVSDKILKLPDVVISDSNAASRMVRFLTPDQITELDFGRIYADDWRHEGNPTDYSRHKKEKCAEVLVPHGVEFSYVTGAQVASRGAGETLKSKGFPADLIKIVPHTFFSNGLE